MAENMMNSAHKAANDYQGPDGTERLIGDTTQSYDLSYLKNAIGSVKAV